MSTNQKNEVLPTTNKQKYDQAFITSFSIDENQLGENLAYNQLPAWDSIGHMTLVAALEDAFGISMETDDIMNFSSYTKGMELMAKYGIKI